MKKKTNIFSEWSDFQKVARRCCFISDYESIVFVVSSVVTQNKNKNKNNKEKKKSAKESNAKTFPQIFFVFFRLLVVVLKVSSLTVRLFT